VVFQCKPALRVALASLAAGVVALSGTAALAVSPRAAVTFAGAGSTFVAPLMTGQWIPDYTRAHPDVRIVYAAIGSTAGLSRWTARQVDFAASDAQLTPDQERAAAGRCGGAVVKIPATISAMALVYNVPGVRSGLKLSPAVIADIFLGRVTRWDDPAIQGLNAGVRLPNLGIRTIHRTGGSGTTFIFTNYLSSVSPQWKSGPGAGANLARWPTGGGAKGSAGVVQAVATTLGAIGYVDLAYAIQNTLDYADVRNAHGSFVRPGVDAASSAADSLAAAMPRDLQQIIVNAPAAGAYPITGYSYVDLCGRQAGAAGRALVDFVRYAVTTGQATVSKLYYAPLPLSVQRLDTAALDKVASS